MADPIISKETTAALLGRSLSTIESTNYDLYLSIATARVEDLLCTTLTAPLEVELQLLLARAFGLIASEQSAVSGAGVKTKKIEDFSVTYKDETQDPMIVFVSQNQAIIDKYSECHAGIRAGETYGECIRII